MSYLLAIISMYAQAIDLSGFAPLLFLFLGLGALALAFAVSLAVIIVILDIVGIDVLGLAKQLRGGG